MITDISTRRCRWLLLLAAMPWLQHSSHGAIVDWLIFTPGIDRTHFSLSTDGGTAFAQAELQITSGVLAPFSPSAGFLSDAYWVTAPGYSDSHLGNESVATTKVQVAPQAGLVSYQLTVQGADLSGLLFSAGQLFGNSSRATDSIDILAMTGGGSAVPVSFLGTHGWDDGIRLDVQPLVWNPSTGKLSLAPASNGESAFAFFTASAGSGPVTKLVFNVPSGYNAGVGDAVEFAFGISQPSSVPEPGGALVGAVLSAFVAAQTVARKRR